MDPLLDARLKTIEAKLDEQSKILTRLNRAQKIATYTRYFYWFILIVVGVASIYFVTPYIGQLGAAYGLTGSSDGSGNGNSTSDLLTQLKQFQAENQ